MKLPLKVTVDLRASTGFSSSYELTVAVPAIEPITTVALIEATESGDPIITRVEQSGLDSLPDVVRNYLLLDLFKLASGEMITNDGSSIEWWFSDISRFLKARFGAADAASISFLLGSLVDQTSDDTRDLNVVRID
ncbi:MAG: hypothetical protein QM754_06370 [Tepidisphaeraceae bacterium]